MLNHHFEVKQEAAQRRRYGLLITGLLIFLFTAVLLSFWVGYYPLSPSQVVTAFLSRFGYEGEILPQAVTIFWNIRLPRILSAVFIGASLSTAGAALSGNVPQSFSLPRHLGSLLRSQSGSRFCNPFRRL